MELTYALVLLIAGSVIAGPHGYGTKGGAAAKADARAVAGAYAGTGLPLNIPSGSSYSGSFSKSSSSSSSSSSASSSAFSYSGSGTIGGVLPTGNGCGSGNCDNGGVTDDQGSAAAGSQAYTGANAGFITGGNGGRIPTGSYGHKHSSGGSQANKDRDCGSQGCQGTNSNSLNGNGAAYDSQSTSDAKAAAASAGAVTKSSDSCRDSNCKNEPDGDNKCLSGQCDSKPKCSSGYCDTDSLSGGTSSHGPIKCTSSECELNHDKDGSSAIYSENNDINVHALRTPNSKPRYDTTGPGCVTGNCGYISTPGSSSSGYSKPALDLTVPKLDSTSCSGFNCHISNPGYSSQTKAPHVSTANQNENQLGYVSSSSNGSPSKPTSAQNYAPSSFPTNPAGETNCAPDNPGCNTPLSAATPVDCVSGNCASHTSTPSSYGNVPSYIHGSSPSYSSVYSASSACAPGSSGCNTNPSGIRLSDCVSGNCSPPPSGYISSEIIPSFGSSPTYSTNPPSAGCAPGSPGCATSISPISTNGCASGNCGDLSTSTSYSAAPNNKPAYSPIASVPYSPSSGSGCAPGTPGCGVAPASGSLGCGSKGCGSIPSVSGYGGAPNNKPGYFHGNSYTPAKPLEQLCSPGSPGCFTAPTASNQPSCISGNCNLNPLTPGHSGSISDAQPDYSSISSPSLSSSIPSGPACNPGSPGCRLSPTFTSPSGCVSGNCGSYPSSTSSFTNSKPINSYESMSTTQAQLKPSGLACVPGTFGCSLPVSPSESVGCTSGYCNEFVPLGGQGVPNSKPIYSQVNSPSYFPVKPTGPVCAPGIPGCRVTSSPGCISGNCGVYPSLQGPTIPQSGDDGLAPVTGISAPGYASAGFGSSLHQGAYGAHGSGSYNKPPTSLLASVSGSGTYSSAFPTGSAVSGIVSLPHSSTSAPASQHSSKDKPAYTGGFGGPAGLLKPNEYNAAPTTSYGNKPAVQAQPATVKPNCVLGICGAQVPPSPSHTGSSISGVAGATASADAVAYTGGFGGPPGFLKPYDDGKIDLKGLLGKQHTGSSLNLHQGVGMTGIHSTNSNGGSSQVGGSAVAQANAAAVSSPESTSGINGGYSNGQAAGGCGSGCGGNGSGGTGYGGSLALSKSGVLDVSSDGLATGGAAAKSVANTSSGARAFGNSYASSSASAHAGASVKGGYGRR